MGAENTPSLHDIGKTEGKFQQKQEQMKELLKEHNLLQFVPPAERIRHERII
ncbi:MAG: HD domain-containing protein [Candidatus Limivicinus sp.]